MIICRCGEHPPKGNKHNYTYYAYPVGYSSNTSSICGRKKCQKPGLIYMTDDEYTNFVNGERIFFFPTFATKVKVEDKTPMALQE